ncbi:Acyl-[acyl-carrier-protein] hydrolase [Heracleum sosnowskyi]|uniref:Acyl-[acyl-carrier-protein] hydrolase n=1 Tax=Heracleum sosnowskyi TaxID=360622 RepID=A0AAD8I926_9APIA|nr:Acyl-[acyl-carrier-protein] hydrolase [Heracleum sosnowskyi]
MASSFVSYLACYNICYFLAKDSHNLSKLKLPKIDISRAGNTSAVTKITTSAVSSFTHVTENLDTKQKQTRQNIPTTKQFVDPHRQGRIIDNGVRYRQMVVIRSYEVGPDKTATLESILNLLQETGLNHVWMSGLLGDGFGATHGMTRNDLMWVVSKLQLQVEQYPIWGEVLQLDTWVGASGKNGMRRDWELRSQATGIVFARATSTWVMMNKKTRRLSKMLDEVRAEISPWFIEKQAIMEDTPEKIKKLDDTAKHGTSSLKAKRSDLDMNHHVNNVKYVGWMLETMPDEFMEEYQLSNIILEYKKECGSSDIVQALSEPDEDNRTINGSLGSLNGMQLKYTHLLQTKGEVRKEEIVRGRTTWRKKHFKMPFPM